MSDTNSHKRPVTRRHRHNVALENTIVRTARQAAAPKRGDKRVECPHCHRWFATHEAATQHMTMKHAKSIAKSIARGEITQDAGAFRVPLLDRFLAQTKSE